MKINYRQMSVLVFMSFVAVKLLALPSWLYMDSENMSFLVIFGLMFVDMLFALLIIDSMKKCGCKNISEFLIQTIGKIGAIISLALVAIKYMIVIAIIEKGLEFFILENLYEDFSWLVYGLPLIAISCFMVYKGLRNIARVAEFFWIIIIIGCAFIAVRAIQGVDLLEFLPLFKDGATPIFKGAFTHLSWFGSSTFLLMLYGKVDFRSRPNTKPILFILGAIVLVMTLVIIFYGLFGGTSPIHQFAISDISQYANDNSSISELSWFVVCLWIIAQIIQLSIYGYCFVSSVMYLFGIHNKAIGVTSLAIYLLVWKMISFYIVDSEKIFLHPITSIINLAVDYLLVVMLLIISSIKRTKRGQYEQVKKPI